MNGSGAESGVSPPAELTGEASPLVYILSSVYGLGHSSRAVAVAQELDPQPPLTFIANSRAHDFIQGNLSADYHAAMRFTAPNYSDITTDDQYAIDNEHLVSTFESARTVVNDFQKYMPSVRYLMNRAGVKAPFVGLYHSIAGYNSDSQEVLDYRQEFVERAQHLDYLFLTEPKPEHDRPYQFASGTVVVPCDPIVRRPTLSASEVKAQFGLRPDEDFIYVQGGGMLSGEELEKVAASAQALAVEGLKVVLSGSLAALVEGATMDEAVVLSPPRLDGHNVIAAAAGVITKPGMGTICEAIASRTPLLLVDYPTAEGRAKFDMMKDILGDSLPSRLYPDQDIAPQIAAWVPHFDMIARKFGRIPCAGAQSTARALTDLAK